MKRKIHGHIKYLIFGHFIYLLSCVFWYESSCMHQEIIFPLGISVISESALGGHQSLNFIEIFLDPRQVGREDIAREI
jgi:hypothetical protein